MKITKEYFIKTMQELQSLEKDIENVDKALKKLDPDFGGFYISRCTNLILDILKVAMNDKYEWIDYYIFELDWGSKWHPGTVTENKGKKDIKLKTLEDLYNYITHQNK